MIRFIDIIGRTLPRNRVKDISVAMMLTEDEDYILFERCAGLKTHAQFDKPMARRCKDLIPILNTKVQLWYFENYETFFSPLERKALTAALDDLRKQRPSEFLF